MASTEDRCCSEAASPTQHKNYKLKNCQLDDGAIPQRECPCTHGVKNRGAATNASPCLLSNPLCRLGGALPDLGMHPPVILSLLSMTATLTTPLSQLPGTNGGFGPKSYSTFFFFMDFPTNDGSQE